MNKVERKPISHRNRSDRHFPKGQNIVERHIFSMNSKFLVVIITKTWPA
ncbi:hypothetical protein LINPERHAP2_LOCUS23084, partial [Linum perenne]